MKIAVVTPYYQEDREVLERCLGSVLSQTLPCTHILIADGHAQDWVAASPRTEHVCLPRANGDNGNTPRGIGSLLAASWDYDAVAYLDADNWFDDRHIESLTQKLGQSGAAIIASKRTFHALDGRALPIFEIDEDTHTHVDTSCFLLTRAAFDLFPLWFMPKALSPICDRVFFSCIQQSGHAIAFTDQRTVAFRSQYAVHYRAVGMEPPGGAKEASNLAGAFAYLNDPVNREAFAARFGFRL